MIYSLKPYASNSHSKPLLIQTPISYHPNATMKPPNTPGQVDTVCLIHVNFSRLICLLLSMLPYRKIHCFLSLRPPRVVSCQYYRGRSHKKPLVVNSCEGMSTLQVRNSTTQQSQPNSDHIGSSWLCSRSQGT